MYIGNLKRWGNGVFYRKGERGQAGVAVFGNSWNRMKVGEGKSERGRGPSWRVGLTILSPMLFHITVLYKT